MPSPYDTLASVLRKVHEAFYFFRKIAEFKETLIGQCIILLRAITPLLLSWTHSIHTEEINCVNTQLETMAQLWLTLGLGLIHNWVSQSCFALYVGNKHLTYFSGAGAIWDEQASTCSFKGHWRGIPDAGLWVFGDIITIDHQRRDYRGQNRT